MADKYRIRSCLFYTSEHTWAELMPDKTVKVGITDYAQKQLREVVFCELPMVGDKVKQMKPAGSLESVKAIYDFHAPLSGKVRRVNRELRNKPSLVNSDPYGIGWVLIIHPENLEGELQNLLKAESYRKLLKELEK